MVDWSDPKAMISKYFSVREALWLPSWQVLTIPTEEEKAQILLTGAKLDLIREDLDQPIHVHCWLRPNVANCPGSRWHGKNYNAFVGGRPGSAHIEGKAVDFNASSWVCDDLREYLLPKLKELDIRMENLPGANWVHIDLREPLPKQSRYFRP